MGRGYGCGYARVDGLGSCCSRVDDDGSVNCYSAVVVDVDGQMQMKEEGVQDLWGAASRTLR